MEAIYEVNAKIFKAFCDENRLKIIELLQSGEKCACTLLETLTIGQPTLSHHMKILTDSGVVATRRDGKWTYYTLSQTGCAHTKELLDTLLTINSDPNTICKC